MGTGWHISSSSVFFVYSMSSSSASLSYLCCSSCFSKTCLLDICCLADFQFLKYSSPSSQFFFSSSFEGFLQLFLQMHHLLLFILLLFFFFQLLPVIILYLLIFLQVLLWGLYSSVAHFTFFRIFIFVFFCVFSCSSSSAYLSSSSLYLHVPQILSGLLELQFLPFSFFGSFIFLSFTFNKLLLCLN